MHAARPTPERSDDRRPAWGRVALLVLVALLAGAVVVVGYALFVRTATGQRLDGYAYDQTGAIRRADRPAELLLATITYTSLPLLVAALVLLALFRGRWRLALCVGAAVGGAIVSTEVLKEVVLTRPALSPQGGPAVQSYPSGHATIGMAVALALVSIAPRRWRTAAGVVGAAIATAFGFAVLAARWHRPSDSIGAFAMALGWACLAAAVLVGWRGRGRRLHPVHRPRTWPLFAGVAVVGSAGVVAVVLALGS